MLLLGDGVSVEAVVVESNLDLDNDLDLLFSLGRVLLVDRFLILTAPGLLDPLRLLLDSTGVRICDCMVGAGGGRLSDSCFESGILETTLLLLRLPLSAVFFRCQ